MEKGKRELDSKNIKERRKLEKKTMKKIFAAIFMYFIIMVIFYFTL